MRLEIRYTTSFAYPERVLESHNSLRACPAETAGQRLVSYAVSTTPSARVVSHDDYWGTRVDSFGIREPHDHLVVVADSVVETDPKPAPTAAAPADAFGDPAFVEPLREYLEPTAHTRWGGEVADAARNALAGAADAPSAVRAIEAAISGRLSYVPGATFVGMDVNDVYAQGQGVCQDFVHLALAMYRSAKIPARYVSGYFYAAEQYVGEAPVEAEIAVQTHAWLEVALPGHGWWALDPTNPIDVGERHVKIGHGRDYDDVPPMRGVYHGAQDHRLGVDVRISREDLSRFQEDRDAVVWSHQRRQEQ